ncbi:MAG TPA: ABC transporter ATP-binding protein [Devosiaceae bacterium]|nr:ABC transporter ATP-binding protein [Devosiaceae bacterium]
MAEAARLRLEGVEMRYHDGERMIEVLSGATLEAAPGEILAIVAPSGAGKSTLLHIAGLLERQVAGEVSLGGQPTSVMSDRMRTLMRRRWIGYVYQFHNLLPEFTALENVAMPQLIAGTARGDAEGRGAMLLEMMGLGERGSHRPAELSGGEQQRVAIARAIANQPALILADEPTGNLDPDTSRIVFEALAELIRNQGAASVIATHNHDLARLADRVVTLEHGRVVPHKL